MAITSAGRTQRKKAKNDENMPKSQQETPIQIGDQIEFFIKIIQDHTSNDQLEDAAQIMLKFLEPLDDDLHETAIMLAGRLKALNRDCDEDTITNEDHRVQRARIMRSMLNFVNEEVRTRVHLKQQSEALLANIGKPAASAQRRNTLLVPPQGLEEKIIGNKNEMVPTAWAAKAILASKSVCRVLVGGRPDGTGFLIKGGYVVTNAHVLPTDDKVKKAEIEFEFEEGSTKTTRYKLDVSDVRRSPQSRLDYCIVKVKDNDKKPLKQFGYLELELEMEVRTGDKANIVQHPWGGVKQLAFRSNDIISVWDTKYFYNADTDEGSSGSPVFNDQWKVVALHSRGANEDDGGMQINPEGDIKPANMGFSIMAIAEDAGLDN
jgi:V8-like Glu-specific endopeptidase